MPSETAGQAETGTVGLGMIGVCLQILLQDLGYELIPLTGTVFLRQNQATIHILSDNPDTLGYPLSPRAS